MIEAGDRVLVDMEGRAEPSFDGAPAGTVIRVGERQGLVSVRLDEPFEGESVALVRPERLRLV